VLSNSRVTRFAMDGLRQRLGFCEKKNDGLFCKRDTDWAEKSLLYSFGTKNGEKGYYALFSSSVAWVASLVVSSIGAPLAARLAIMPSLVCGMYAPPVKV